MHNTTQFFPGFHHRLFGRKPLTAGAQLDRAARRADTLCLTQLHTLIEGVLPPWLATFKTARDALSFKGTMDRFDQWQWAIWSAPNTRQARRRREDLLQTIADDPVIKRPGRKEPRVCKDRQNKYTLMTKPRRSYGPTDDASHAA